MGGDGGDGAERHRARPSLPRPTGARLAFRRRVRSRSHLLLAPLCGSAARSSAWLRPRAQLSRERPTTSDARLRTSACFCRRRSPPSLPGPCTACAQLWPLVPLTALVGGPCHRPACPPCPHGTLASGLLIRPRNPRCPGSHDTEVRAVHPPLGAGHVVTLTHCRWRVGLGRRDTSALVSLASHCIPSRRGPLCVALARPPAWGSVPSWQSPRRDAPRPTRLASASPWGPRAPGSPCSAAARAQVAPCSRGPATQLPVALLSRARPHPPCPSRAACSPGRCTPALPARADGGPPARSRS